MPQIAIGSNIISKAAIGNDSNLDFNPPCGNFLIATGGTVTYYGSYKIHTFTTGSYNFVVEKSGVAEMMMIGGGGGGGITAGGGGGAGGYFYTSSLDFYANNTYTMTVGNGATESQQINSGPYPGNALGTTGSASIITGSNIQIIAFGGGGGGSYASASSNPRAAGANSGGGAGYGTSAPAGGDPGIILTTAQQPLYNALYNSGSNIGGTSLNGRNGAGGGGGVTQVGQDPVAAFASNRSIGGTGGRGIENPIVGSTIGELSGSVYYVGGGGGGAGGTISFGNGVGGLGGGGYGGNDEYCPNFPFPPCFDNLAGAGMANTGGGSGGVLNGAARPSGFQGRPGGTGVIIIKYQYKCFNT
jgi:hypothetical protein